MIKREYKKPIQKNRNHCDKCALVKEFCICDFTPTIKSSIKFILLTHSNELKKRSNTGILIEQSLQDVVVIEWIRKEPSKELIDLINSDKDVYLLYPETEIETEKSKLKIINYVNSDNKKDKYIIILDGTWQEAQKMFNRSDYLKNINRLSLNPLNLSNYKLRRKKSENHLCTVEAAIIAMEMFDEKENSHILSMYFDKFQNNYEKSKSN